MTYFGETLRKAREAKGMTTSQVAEKTRILVQIIDAMEREDFTRIKAAIYGRGFVKLICECLDIDPKPLVAEFMDIYEGRRPPVPSDVFQPKPPPPTPAPEPEPPAEPTPEPEPAPVPEPAQETAPEVPEAPERPSEVQDAVKGLDLFDPQPQTVEQPPATRAQDIFSSAYPEQEERPALGPSAAEKFRTGLSVVSHGVLGSVRNIPKSAWRIAVLIVGAALVIGLLVWGCVILYRVTEQPTSPAAPAVTNLPAKPKPAVRPPQQSAKQSANPAPAKPQLRSTGEKVPPLYVD